LIIVYDAAHVAMARAARVDRIVTRNKKHFDLFAAGIRVDELKGPPVQPSAS
jgi:hypothetical protein